MRHVLVDRARARSAEKRGGDLQHVELDDQVLIAPASTDPVDLLALGEAIELLERLSPRQCKVVELRAFAGLTIDETASELGVATHVVEDDWAMAKAWLHDRLRPR